MLDSGSQKSYITERLAKTLGLKTEGEQELKLVTFGSEKAKIVKTKSTKVGIKLKNGTEMTITANVVPFFFFLVHLLSPCILLHFRFSPTPTSASPTVVRCPNRRHSVYPNLLNFTIIYHSFYQFTLFTLFDYPFLLLTRASTGLLVSNLWSILWLLTQLHFLYDDHFRIFLPGSPFRANHPYLDSSNRLLLKCYYDVLKIRSS